METIKIFSMNTTNGNTIVLENKTIEEIALALHEKFPKWTMEVCHKWANNEKNYTMVKPLNGKKVKATTTRKSFAEPIIVNGIEINPLMKLGKSLCAYHKNGYRQWGVCINEIFDDWNITPTYNAFERAYENFCKDLKGDALTEQKKKENVATICNYLTLLNTKIKSSGILKEEGEFIEGEGRRLGLRTLTERIVTITADMRKVY